MKDGLPEFQEIFPDILGYLATSSRPLTRKDMIARLAGQYMLDESQLKRKNLKSDNKIIRHRVAWTTVYFREARLLRAVGEIERRQKLFEITDLGRQLHAMVCTGAVPVLDFNYLNATYPAFRVYHAGNSARKTTNPDEDWFPEHDTTDLEDLVHANHKGVTNEFTRWLDALGQGGLERLSRRLMGSMGYNAREGMGEHGANGLTGLSCYENPTFDVVHAMVRHCPNDQALGSGIVEQFSRYVDRQDGRGLLLSNGRACEEARELARLSQGSVRLIAGQSLSELLVRQQVGVVAERGLTLYRLDGDFLNTL